MEENVLEVAIKKFLEEMGEDPSRPGLSETPERYVRALRELFKGLETPKPELKTFKTEYLLGENDLIVVKNVSFSSLCEHHLLPILGRASIVYHPKRDEVIGLSKIPRIVKWLAKRPMLQERFTAMIADEIMKAGARGVYVLVRAKHSCVAVRGVEDPDVEMITEAVRGTLEANPSLLERARKLVLD
ncbi:GTP cyclohydrolase I [Ignicoccus hospitalis]|uniref:GTP cyclohydrolase 1 n=1 Tax=Ignicoccus hospitalis (strain KIN4/I / DSM 18386 / JCM 14125) TaxID=453591 RepID=A8AA62_IGNH4|nr:GTP cyclohydrolase I [Ignicoccus hospitalis]ABU81814.1 GTP cyclohydrolase [Ignicoccus hospitalis KIN4/I]HIH90083.1 GTP cyclohydrolase I [Desulfurococcaceae archaeon]